LTFLCLPLLGDVFSVQTVISVFDMMGLGGSGLGLVKTLPMVMMFLEAQPLNILYQHLVNKPLQASPIQRWLRDTLLQFQAYMASDVEDEDYNEMLPTDVDANSCLRRYRAHRKKKELLDLLTDVIASRYATDHEGVSVETPSRMSDDDARHSDEEDLLIKETPVPSLDEVVRYLFRPAWLLARRSYHLEFVFMLVAQVSEVLDTINEQLERRTFGEMTLKGTSRAWYVVAKQLRVTLLICSRTAGNVSVEALGSGNVSLYTLLATDTLCFAMQPEQAVEHELRCQEVYNRRAGKDDGKVTAVVSGGRNKSSDGSANSSGSALLAWGDSADTRWKELIGIADMEDIVLQETGTVTPLMTATAALLADLNKISSQLTQLLAVLAIAPQTQVTVASPLASHVSSSSAAAAFPATSSLLLSSVSSSSRSNSPAMLSRSSRNSIASSDTRERPSKDNKKVRRRRPLLLFFPNHNQPVPLAAYRACALADRWRRRPKRLEMLTLAGAHLFPLPPVTRAAVAEQILLTTVFPLLLEYLKVEEGGLHHSPSKKSAVTPPRGNVLNSKESDERCTRIGCHNGRL
jgi:hypothetical protein